MVFFPTIEQEVLPFSTGISPAAYNLIKFQHPDLEFVYTFWVKGSVPQDQPHFRHQSEAVDPEVRHYLSDLTIHWKFPYLVPGCNNL